MAPLPPPRISAAPILTTAIIDSGASDIYFPPGAPVANINPSAPLTHVGDTAGNSYQSSARASHLLTNLPVKEGNIMPTFKHNLVGVNKLCDHGCRVLFDTDAVTVFNKTDNSILLQGWLETSGAKLWQFSLLPHDPPPTALSCRHLRTHGTQCQ